MPDQAFSLRKIAIVGGGKMGEAILAGLLAGKDGQPAVEPSSCIVVNPGEERRAFLASTYGVPCVAHVSELPSCTVCILAVKPQILPQVLEEMAGYSWLSQALVISIAAGISSAAIEAALPEGASVVRAMPNLPLVVGRGAVGVCEGAQAVSGSAAFVCGLFQGFGRCLVVDESQMDAVTAVSGSGPAYAAALVEAMAQAGVELGLSAEVAEELAVATVEGTGVLLAETGQGARALREAVCSPGGTTLAALDAMERAGYSASIRAGVHAAAVRSKELSS